MVDSISLEHLPAIVAAHQAEPGGLIPCLHAIQDRFGYVPANATPLLAIAFNQSRAEIHGVITYYSYFRRTPVAEKLIEVCNAEACRACGSEKLLSEILEWTDCVLGEPGPDDKFQVKEVFCLGLCAMSPAVQINEVPLGRVNLSKVQLFLAKDTVPKLPKIERSES